MIRLAVVDDSAFVRKAVVRIMEGEDDVIIAGTASSGEELLEHLDEWNPTAITLDLSMPGIGGLATLERILAWRRVPVVILSGHAARDGAMTVEALHRGAVDFVDKHDFSLVDFQRLRAMLLPKLRAFTGAAVEEDRCPPPPARATPSLPQGGAFELVVIGASTGGPPAIERVLEELGGPPAVPVMIVQHMPAGFTTAFAQRLNGRLPFPVEEVVHNQPLAAGSVYIAAAGMHLRVRSERERLVASLARYPETQHRPAVDVLFRSAAALAPRVIGVLLTGMGDDGARGLLELAQHGALTLAEDESSCVVYGMPRAAMELGAVGEQLPLSAIAPRLRQLLGMQ
jgi:two-component system chemotaxis response regulator CheB